MGDVEPVVFKPDRTALTAVVVLFLGSLPLGLVDPYAALVFLLPLAALVWVLRAKVIGTATGLTVCNGLVVRRIGWADVDRFELPKRGPVVLHRLQGKAIRLTALPRERVRDLVAAAS